MKLAEEARELCAVSDRFPGTQKSRVTLEANVAVCEVLTGKSERQSWLASRVQSKNSQASTAIPLWALAVHHTRLDDVSAAEKHLAVVKRILPNDTPLNALSRL